MASLLDRLKQQINEVGPSLLGQYQETIAPIREKSNQLLKEYGQFESAMPGFAQRLIDAIKKAGKYPSTSNIRAEFMQNPNLTPAAVEAMTAKRAQSTLGTVQDLINRVVGGFEGAGKARQTEYEVGRNTIQDLISEYQLGEESRRNSVQDLMSQYQLQLTEEQLPGGRYYVPPRGPERQPSLLEQLGPLGQVLMNQLAGGQNGGVGGAGMGGKIGTLSGDKKQVLTPDGWVGVSNPFAVWYNPQTGEVAETTGSGPDLMTEIAQLQGEGFVRAR